ncbi:hypothetical protein [Metabacillus fastidiosus]
MDEIMIRVSDRNELIKFKHLKTYPAN